ncbi:MAG: hypothetical protein JW959_02510 [Pirellulales bacterium]|nr:hypothetical protein [Pirellulales bacterium]
MLKHNLQPLTPGRSVHQAAGTIRGLIAVERFFPVIESSMITKSIVSAPIR